MRRARSDLFLALIAAAAICGCSRFYPVEGQLAWSDGTPATELAGSAVYFESTEHRTISRSIVTKDATFRLTTERPEDGVPRGLHRVYIVENRGGPSEASQRKPPRIDERFLRPETSGLEVTVPPQEKLVVLKIERARRQ